MVSVPLVLAFSTGIAVNTLVVGGLVAVFMHDTHFVVSDNYVAMVTGTLGVMIGSLATYLGTSHHHNANKDNS